mmetsp:Transcript_131329/g.366125  ORF Transcript_131329/g.366125 Transcript_131329/m.366125 type:complete len:91 (-) Transcript_131329:76-348(-)
MVSERVGGCPAELKGPSWSAADTLLPSGSQCSMQDVVRAHPQLRSAAAWGAHLAHATPLPACSFTPGCCLCMQRPPASWGSELYSTPNSP